MEESVVRKWETDDWAKITLHNGIEWCMCAVWIPVPAGCVCVCPHIGSVKHTAKIFIA